MHWTSMGMNESQAYYGFIILLIMVNFIIIGQQNSFIIHMGKDKTKI